MIAIIGGYGQVGLGTLNLLFSAYVGILIYQNIFVKNTFCKRTDTYPSYNKA